MIKKVGMPPFLIMILALAMSFTCYGQDTTGSTEVNYHFVKIADLSPETYAKAVKSIRATGYGDVGMACIPVELIRLDLDNNSSIEIAELKSLLINQIKQATGLNSVVFVDSLNQELFEEACTNARYGVSNN
jgi:hypothetical protein